MICQEQPKRQPVLARLRYAVMTSVIAMSFVAGPPAPAMADGNAFVGGLIGGIIGNAIANDVGRRRSAGTTTRRSTSSVSSAQREANRTVQTALNHFGFPVGTPDGSIGPKTRSAISTYQVVLGYPATGRLDDVQRAILTGAYTKAMLGGSAVMQVVANHPQGIRGLLFAERDLIMGGSNVVMAGTGGQMGGLPPEVAASVMEIAQNSNVQPAQLVQRSGFIQLADMNADGRTDYLLDTSVTGSAFWCNAQACAVRVFASTPEGYNRNDFQAFNAVPVMFDCVAGTCTKNDAGTLAVAPVQPAPGNDGTTMVAATIAPTINDLPAQPVPSAQPVVSNPDAAAVQAPGVAGSVVMPTFGIAPKAIASLASHCTRVSLVTSTNGGFVTEASMTDPAQALAEQFCLARGYAITTGEELAAQAQGVTPEQISSECARLKPLFNDAVSGLSLQSRADVVKATADILLKTGAAPSQLSGTAKVCLSVGYRTDDMDMALDAALILTAVGEGAYDELLGHHLALGFGTSTRPDLAMDWYQSGFTTLARGGQAVFAPAQPERAALIQKAAMAVSGAGTSAPAADQPVAASTSVMPNFALPVPAATAQP